MQGQFYTFRLHQSIQNSMSILTQHSVVPFSNRQPRPSFQLATSATSDQFYSATLLLPLLNTTIPVCPPYYLFSPSDSFFSNFPNSSYTSCFLCPSPCRYTQQPSCCPKRRLMNVRNKIPEYSPKVPTEHLVQLLLQTVIQLEIQPPWHHLSQSRWLQSDFTIFV